MSSRIPPSPALVLETLPEGVVLHDETGQVLSANEAARRILHALPLDLLSRPEGHTARAVVREDGAPFPATEYPSILALRTGREQRNVVMGLRAADGATRWLTVSAVPLFCGDPAVASHACLVLGDVTARTGRGGEQGAPQLGKEDFLAVLSHELRNPLAPIRNAVHVLKHAEPGAERSRRAVAIMERQVDLLARLVDDLLQVRQVSAGKLRLDAHPLDVARALQETVEDLRPSFAERGIALDFRGTGADLWVVGDAVRLSQVFANLLQNAVKFTEPGGHVEVAVDRHGAEACIRIRDDGIGIAPDQLEQIFLPFVQVEASSARNLSGLGLGLALVRGIVQLHRGSVVAHSAGAGKGTEFVITLPAADGAPERLPWAVRRNVALTGGTHHLDAQHAAMAIELAELRHASEESLPERLRTLFEDATAHFTAEEQVMKAVDYPDLASHEAAHARILDGLAVATERARPSPARTGGGDSLVREVEHALSLHGTGEDLLLARFLGRAEPS